MVFLSGFVFFDCPFCKLLVLFGLFRLVRTCNKKRDCLSLPCLSQFIIYIHPPAQCHIVNEAGKVFVSDIKIQ